MDMNEWMSGLRSFSSKIGKPIPSGQKTIFETYISDSLFDYIDEPRIQEACLKGHTSVFDNIPNSEEWDQLSFLILQYLGDVFEMGSTFGEAYRGKCTVLLYQKNTVYHQVYFSISLLHIGLLMWK